MSPKLKCYQNWNVIKHKNVLKNKIKIQEIGTEYLGIVIAGICVYNILQHSSVTVWSIPSGQLLFLTLLFKHNKTEHRIHEIFMQQ